MLSTMGDSELVAAARSGDREALRCLVERHYDMIYRVAYYTMGSKADAEDVAQDVCVTLATRLGKFANRSRFTTWVTSVAINRCRDVLRRGRSADRLTAKYAAFRDLEQGDKEDNDRRLSWLDRALAKLEPGLRETVILVLSEGKTHKEAAKILGCAEGTVSWRLAQVRETLRGLMDDDDE